MEFGDAVDGVAADRGEMGHAHESAVVVVDERKPLYARFIAGESEAHAVEVTAVDFVDDLEMTGEQSGEEAARPLLQCLREQGVVGIGEAMPGDVPGHVPLEGVLIDEEAHQLRDGDGGVGVVHLNGEAAMQFGKGPLLRELDMKDVLQGAGHEEELLGQAQLLALNAVIVGIEDF